MYRLLLRNAVLLLCHVVVCSAMSTEDQAIRISVIVAGIAVPIIILFGWFCCCSKRGKTVSSAVGLSKSNVYEFQTSLTSPMEVKSFDGENFAYVSLQTGAYRNRKSISAVNQKELFENSQGNNQIEILVWEPKDSGNVNESYKTEDQRQETLCTIHEQEDNEAELNAEETSQDQPDSGKPDVDNKGDKPSKQQTESDKQDVDDEESEVEPEDSAL